MRRLPIMIVHLAAVLVGCSRPAREEDSAFRAATECIGESERCVLDALGRPDEERMGPSEFDKQFVYEKSQLTVNFFDRSAPVVLAVGTGVAKDVHHFGGKYDGSALGVHHGDAIQDVEKLWGAGEPASAVDARLGNQYRYYPKKIRTKAGRDIDVTVHYTNAKGGVFYISASRALGSR
jgi:hypothetical protein